MAARKSKAAAAAPAGFVDALDVWDDPVRRVAALEAAARLATGEGSPVVYRWAGDTSVVHSGVPHRDVTQYDLDSGLIDAELVESAGTHEKV